MNLASTVIRRKGLLGLVLVVLFFLTLTNLGFGQATFTLSKNSDFSSNDRSFSRDDTLYMKVLTTAIDVSNLKKNQWELESHSHHLQFEGTFINHGDGSFTANFDLAQLPDSHNFWKWECKIEDFSDNKFEAEAYLTIDGMGPPGRVVEVEGTISAIGEDSLVVNDFTFFVDANTQIIGHHHMFLTFNDLVVGLWVEVKGYRRADGTLLATRIKVKDHVEYELEVEGTITAIGDDSLVVNGFVFFVNDQTLIEGKHHTVLDFSDLNVGQWVEVKAVLQSDGSYLAIKIELERGERIGGLEVEGTIETLGADSLVVAGITFFVNDQTVIEGRHHLPLTFQDLVVGQWVEVKASQQSDGSLLALKIKVEDEPKNEIELTGVIDSLTTNSVFVFGLEFFVDNNTEILDHHKNAVTFADLQVGQTVEIKALRQPDDTLLALRIKVEDLYQVEVEIEGPIEALGNDSLVVSGITFWVNAQTQILDWYKNPISLSDLQVGRWIEVRAVRQADGSFLATRIKLEKEGTHKVNITGAIVNIGTDYLVVAGITFWVDNSTDIFDERNRAITFSELAIGQLVKVKAVLQADGRLLATKIKIKHDPINGLQFSGEIQALGTNSLVISQSTFKLDDNTIVLDTNYRVTSFFNLNLGNAVTVWLKRQDDNSLLTLQIKILSPNQFTAAPLENSYIMPSRYVLHQNYPNPFNPTTTISFVVMNSQQTSQHTTLQIYNLLGRHIRTLIDQPLEQGSYTMIWDGRDSQGRLVSTGVYFYQLRIGEVRLTRRMVLTK